jgi:translocator assembly and maintenance protein 41
VLREDVRVKLANQVNLASALRTAILFLPETFSEDELYRQVAGLSYKGDFRMQMGENPRKVSNIVSAQFDEFHALYKPLLDSFRKHVTRVSPESRQLAQDVSPGSRAYVLSKLPIRLRDKIKSYYERKWNLEVAGVVERPASSDKSQAAADEEGLWLRIVTDEDFPRVLEKSEEFLSLKKAFG